MYKKESIPFKDRENWEKKNLEKGFKKDFWR